MEATADGLRLTRDDLVTLAAAVEEFRDEYSGPHLQQGREEAEQIRSLLGGSGDEWVLTPKAAMA